VGAEIPVLLLPVWLGSDFAAHAGKRGEQKWPVGLVRSFFNSDKEEIEPGFHNRRWRERYQEYCNKLRDGS
jgi:hypothetical protein